ncbi:hypothetical protein [Acinetobacter pittii]|uniref:hypothetical protein n=1 Tax=Acinetobacter pittii TaxID=48296 RepID=UPI00300AD6E7
MQHKDEAEKNTKQVTKPEDVAMKQLEIDNLKKKIDELNKLFEKFSKNNSKIK